MALPALFRQGLAKAPLDRVLDVPLVAAFLSGIAVTLVFVVAQRYNVFVQRGSAAAPVSTVISVVTISALMILYDV